MKKDLRKRSFLKLLDFTQEEIAYLLELAAKLKKAKKTDSEIQYLKSKNIALIFDASSCTICMTCS